MINGQWLWHHGCHRQASIVTILLLLYESCCTQLYSDSSYLQMLPKLDGLLRGDAHSTPSLCCVLALSSWLADFFESWFADFTESSVQCISKADDPKSCRTLRDDYLECLHHRKEVHNSSLVHTCCHTGAATEGLACICSSHA